MLSPELQTDLLGCAAATSLGLAINAACYRCGSKRLLSDVQGSPRFSWYVGVFTQGVVRVAA